MNNAERFQQALESKPMLAWELIECIRRLLHGQQLTVKEADEIHALVRQNTVRSRRQQ